MNKAKQKSFGVVAILAFGITVIMFRSQLVGKTINLIFMDMEISTAFDEYVLFDSYFNDSSEIVKQGHLDNFAHAIKIE